MNDFNPFVIADCKPIQRQDCFSVIIVDVPKRSDLTLKGVFICQRSSNLILMIPLIFDCDKIHFCIADSSDTDLITAAYQLEVYDILERKSKIIISAR